MTSKKSILFVMILLAFVQKGSGVTSDWGLANDGSNDWNISTNWTNNQVPGSGDTANIGTVNSVNPPFIYTNSVTVSVINFSPSFSIPVRVENSLQIENSISGTGSMQIYDDGSIAFPSGSMAATTGGTVTYTVALQDGETATITFEEGAIGQQSGGFANFSLHSAG